MKQSRDPFEAALEEEQLQHQDNDNEDDHNPTSPPDSPHPSTAAAAAPPPADDEDYDDYLGPSAADETQPVVPESGHTVAASGSGGGAVGSREKRKRVEKEDEEEEENVDVELRKFSSTGDDPRKMAKMQSTLSQFTEEQMSRYESFRRSVFQKSNMKKLLMNAAGTQKISMPMTIVVSGIAKMFVGELVETARTVMTERKDTGPIRPCHIRESYRRLKLEGKIPKRSVPRLFR